MYLFKITFISRKVVLKPLQETLWKQNFSPKKILHYYTAFLKDLHSESPQIPVTLLLIQNCVYFSLNLVLVLASSVLFNQFYSHLEHPVHQLAKHSLQATTTQLYYWMESWIQIYGGMSLFFETNHSREFFPLVSLSVFGYSS